MKDPTVKILIYDLFTCIKNSQTIDAWLDCIYKIGSKVYDIKHNDFIHIPSQTDHSVMTEKSKVKILFIFGGNILIDK